MLAVNILVENTKNTPRKQLLEVLRSSLSNCLLNLVTFNNCNYLGYIRFPIIRIKKCFFLILGHPLELTLVLGPHRAEFRQRKINVFTQ